MSLYKTFQTDTALEAHGIELEYGYVDGDETRPIRLRIARSGGSNARFAKLLEAKTKPHRRSIQTETIDKKLAERLFMEVFAETVVLGWTNVQDQEGVELPFSKENVIKVFTDLPDLWADVREQSAKASLFRQEVREVDAGN